MGYTTEFEGDFVIDPPLTEEHRAYLTAFAQTRRMRRDEEKAAALPDPLRLAVGLPIGFEGAYFVGSYSDGNFGQSGDESVLGHNDPPGEPQIPPSDPGNPMADFNVRWNVQRELAAKAHQLGLVQPGLWCQWVPNDEGTAIVWDGGEKFYNYVEWIEYLIAHFFERWGYLLNGEVEWRGEESDDRGLIRIVNNDVQTLYAQTTWVTR